MLDEKAKAEFLRLGVSKYPDAWATVDAFENVHVYLALCRALGVAPAPNDGQAAVAQSLLATRQPDRR